MARVEKKQEPMTGQSEVVVPSHEAATLQVPGAKVIVSRIHCEFSVPELSADAVDDAIVLEPRGDARLMLLPCSPQPRGTRIAVGHPPG